MRVAWSSIGDGMMWLPDSEGDYERDRVVLRKRGKGGRERCGAQTWGDMGRLETGDGKFFFPVYTTKFFLFFVIVVFSYPMLLFEAVEDRQLV